MAALQSRDGGYIIPIFVPFDHNRKLPLSFHNNDSSMKKKPAGLSERAQDLEPPSCNHPCFYPSFSKNKQIVSIPR